MGTKQNIEILYVYIHYYRNIKECEFQISNTFKITQKNSEIFSLDINSDSNIAFFNGFEDPHKKRGIISSVTGIVGQNGSGKSSLIEFIADCFRLGDPFKPIRPIDRDAIIIREQNEDGDFIILYHKNRVKKIKTPTVSSNLDFSLVDIYSTYNAKTSLCQSIVPIYYSTSMHDRVSRLSLKEYELANVSDLNCYYETTIPTNVDRPRGNSYMRLSSPSNFKYEDTQRQLTFVGANNIRNFVDISFCKQTNFGLSFSQTYLNSHKYKELVELIVKKYEITNDFQFFQILFCSSVLLRLVFPREKDFNPTDSYQTFLEEFQSSLKSGNNIIDATLSFLRNHLFFSYSSKNEFSDSTFVDFDYCVSEKIELIEFIKDNFQIETFLNGKENTFLLDFNRFDTGKKIFNPYIFMVKVEVGAEFVHLYKRQLSGDFTPDFLELTWSALSAGQLSYLNLFSRFFHGFIGFFNSLDNYSNVRNTKNLQNLLIIIDEGEVYFHPEWQRQYIKSILDFITKLCTGFNIQIIIASNSPFISSDLPKSSLIFLKRGEKNECIVSPNEKHSETFGANIHRLFKDAFYLENGFVGEFAKDKIQYVIDFLYKPEVEIRNASSIEINLAHSIIKTIGEPVIKDKLIELWNIKFDKYDDSYKAD